MKVWTTQWNEKQGDAVTLAELLDYLKESDIDLTRIGCGYYRIAELIELVRQMNINKERKL